jgi:cytoskeleton protein RodZ
MTPDASNRGAARWEGRADASTSRTDDVDHRQLDLTLFPETPVSIAGSEELHDSMDAAREAPAHAADVHATGSDASVGQRLRRERERRGWSRDEVAARLKWQAGLVRRIEEDDYQGISHAVYLRGYLSSYTRLLGMPLVMADHVVATHAQEAPLVSTGTISRSRYLLDRYSVSATYLILTGLVIGPAVWLATHGGLEQNLARTVLLDATPANVATDERVDSPVASADLAVPMAGVIESARLPSASPALEPSPIVASMAPFASATPTMPAAVAVTPPVQRHTLVLSLRQASWVEVTAADGGKLEYGLLAAGTRKEYASDQVIAVRIGNAEGAEVAIDGEAVDLAPFRRANVAHFKAFNDGATVSRADF